MRRREFISGLGGVVAWPVVARAQRTDRLRRMGVLMYQDESDPEGRLRFSGFTQALSELGWTDDRNLRMDVRWGINNVERSLKFAKELVDLQPDVILVNTTPATAALQSETRTIPIVFVGIADPVAGGLVRGLPQPGGNLTGLLNVEGAIAGKWLELLTEIAPGIKRAAIMFNPDLAPHILLHHLPTFEAAARSLKVEAITAPVYNDAEIEMIIVLLGKAGGGLVAPSDSFLAVRRRSIVLLAGQNNVPAIYTQTVYARDGGLLSYGPDYRDMYRRAAPYVDRILRGAKPADLPVEEPVKFEMAVNLKTAKALGLTVPERLLAIADEVLE
jgi:putative ABC transport system substrate-binding protein